MQNVSSYWVKLAMAKEKLDEAIEFYDEAENVILNLEILSLAKAKSKNFSGRVRGSSIFNQALIVGR